MSDADIDANVELLLAQLLAMKEVIDRLDTPDARKRFAEAVVTMPPEQAARVMRVLGTMIGLDR